MRADREIVWAALHDVTCLKLCVPGCSSIERVSAHRFDLVVQVSLGPVSMAFAGVLEIVGSDPLRRLMLEARGTGGLAGFATGSTHITLADVPEGCRVAYGVEAEPSGPFAVAGTILLNGLATSLVDRFVSTFATTVEARNLCHRSGATTMPRGPMA